jgi:hypothetical protein
MWPDVAAARRAARYQAAAKGTPMRHLRSVTIGMLLVLGTVACSKSDKTAAATQTASAEAGYKVGDKLTVDWKGQAYPATVLEVVAKDRYKIHYEGYESNWDEVVGPARIKGTR